MRTDQNWIQLESKIKKLSWLICNYKYVRNAVRYIIACLNIVLHFLGYFSKPLADELKQMSAGNQQEMAYTRWRSAREMFGQSFCPLWPSVIAYPAEKDNRRGHNDNRASDNRCNGQTGSRLTQSQCCYTWKPAVIKGRSSETWAVNGLVFIQFG